MEEYFSYKQVTPLDDNISDKQIVIMLKSNNENMKKRAYEYIQKKVEHFNNGLLNEFTEYKLDFSKTLLFKIK